MKISIVTPAYNAAEFVSRMYENLSPLIGNKIDKWIVIDDQSTDSTEELFKVICKNDTNVIYNKLKKNSGPEVARREGVALSSTDIVMLLDIDDYLYLNSFDGFLNFINDENGYDYWFAPLNSSFNYKEIDPNSSFKHEAIRVINKPTDFIRYGFPQPSSLAMKKNFALKILDNSNLAWGEDIYLYFKAANAGKGIRWLIPVSCYLLTGNGRGSILSLKNRLSLIKRLVCKAISTKENVIDNLFFSFYMSSRFFVSYFYKKFKSIGESFKWK